jgi:hypothetical protein
LRMIIRRLFVLFLLLGYSCMLLGQDNSMDTVVYRAALENASTKSLRAQRSINIGREYTELPYSFKNRSQFFLSDKKIVGEVRYNDILYKNQNLQYDILLDEVIAEHVSGRKIILVKEKVTEFTIGGYLFRRLLKSDIDGSMTPGYYNILIESKGLMLLVKRVGHQKKTRVGYYKEEFSIDDKSKYFLKKDDTFFEVKNYKGITKILRDKEQKSSFRGSKKSTDEQKMIDVVKYFANLR